MAYAVKITAWPQACRLDAQDRRDSALKLAKAKELMDAAHNESQLSAMASSQGHVFDKSVLSEQAQLNQVGPQPVQPN
jgi:hypothetical protein